MKKRLLCITASLVLAFFALSLPEAALGKTELPAIRPLTVVRNPAKMKAVQNAEPWGEYWFTDGNLSSADLSGNPGLAWSLTFSDKTRFPEADCLPAGYDPQALLEWGKAPGLNMDILHRHGFTGKGAVIAYVDQPAGSHEQYEDVLLHYVNNTESESSMHGPAVLSLLAGKDTGTAPEAEIYYYAHASWKMDQTTHAECLYQIIEQNQSLPEEKKIRMVGFSDNIDTTEANAEAFRKAVRACEEAGVMVWFCADYSPLSFIPFSDKNSKSSLMPLTWSGNIAELVFVPSSGRTTAATENGSEYIYWSSGGLSWTMPYVLGVYAIAISIDPTLTQDAIRKLVKETAFTDDTGRKILDPVSFIAAVLQGAGREAEARELLEEVKAETRWLYAVMDTTAMNAADLTAVGDYLAAITDARVLIVEASRFADAQTLYDALQKDAMERGGTVAGVQIFGTPDLVPAFKIRYRVQMADGVDEGGTLLTDLFYGNFDNSPHLLNPEYNVMDHLAEGQEVNLVPSWPVVRLPLSKGQFEDFFIRYGAFVRSTGLERLEIVNFSNPIFAQKEHSDDMGRFLQERMDREFQLMDVPYRLYGNLKGEYPVTHAVLGGFEAENMAAENSEGPLEFIVNTHGQTDNIDNAVFENGKEQRISLVNMKNINKVLSENPYYLDTWTCLNGYNMSGNLTTTALTGQCVGMFSATAIISNNGVNWKASPEEMAQSNFYYFYYHYLKALHEGQTRSQAFFTAQREYGLALMEDSKLPLRTGEGNVQFNLYNLLAYHNFGVIEPNAAALSLCSAQGTIDAARKRARTALTPTPRPKKTKQPNQASAPEITPKPAKGSIQFGTNNLLAGGAEGVIHSITANKQKDGSFSFRVEYTLPADLRIFVFDPPDGQTIHIWPESVTPGGQGVLTFELTKEELKSVPTLTINFFENDNNRFFVFFRLDQVK